MFDWAKNLLAQQAAGAIRHMLSGIGGSLVAKGLMTSDQETAIIGGILAALAVAWSAYQKHAAAKTAKLTAPPDPPAPPADLKGLY